MELLGEEGDCNGEKKERFSCTGSHGAEASEEKEDLKNFYRFSHSKKKVF